MDSVARHCRYPTDDDDDDDEMYEDADSNSGSDGEDAPPRPAKMMSGGEEFGGFEDEA